MKLVPPEVLWLRRALGSGRTGVAQHAEAGRELTARGSGYKLARAL